MKRSDGRSVEAASVIVRRRRKLQIVQQALARERQLRSRAPIGAPHHNRLTNIS
jgi:hypothetical protein